MSFRLAFRIVFGAALLAGAAAAGFYLLSEDLVGAFHGLANKLLTFNVAAIGVFAMELLYDWKHRIDTGAAFNRVEHVGQRSVSLFRLSRPRPLHPRRSDIRQRMTAPAYRRDQARGQGLPARLPVAARQGAADRREQPRPDRVLGRGRLRAGPVHAGHLVRRHRRQERAAALRRGLAIDAWGIETARLERAWKAPRPDEDRWSLVESSYNAGIGWILKAQALCDNASLWDGIMKCLPAVTGEHSKETIGYTLRIRRIWSELKE
jgi:hypothetical protein